MLAEEVTVQTGFWEVAGSSLSLGTTDPGSDFLRWFTALLPQK